MTIITIDQAIDLLRSCAAVRLEGFPPGPHDTPDPLAESDEEDYFLGIDVEDDEGRYEFCFYRSDNPEVRVEGEVMFLREESFTDEDTPLSLRLLNPIQLEPLPDLSNQPRN